MYKRKRAGNTITRKINSTKDTAAKADKNHYISNSYLEGFIPIDTEYFTASILFEIVCPDRCGISLSQPRKHHVIPIASIIQRAIHAADGGRGGPCFFRNLQIGFPLPQHLGYLVALGQGQKFIDRADVFEEFVAFLRVLQAQYSLEQVIHCLRPYLFTHITPVSFFMA